MNLLWFVLLGCSLVLCAGYGYEAASPFGGYYYPKPVRLPQLPPLPAEDQSNASSAPPAGVQADYIDDLIEGHKQQILSNVLGVAPPAAAPASSSPLESPFESSDAKAFRVNRCASCSE